MSVSEKPKQRKQTIAQILRKAYSRYCHDRVTMAVLRQYLRPPHKVGHTLPSH